MKTKKASATMRSANKSPPPSSTQGHPGVPVTLTNPNYLPGSSARFNEWTVRFGGLDEAASRACSSSLQGEVQSTPLFPLASKIGGRVSSNMQFQAILAIVISLVAMVDLSVAAVPEADLRHRGRRRADSRRAGDHRHDRDQRLHRERRARRWQPR